jgi:hypothetical protein
MSKPTQTNALLVVGVDDWRGVTVAVNGENKRISWELLTEAARRAGPRVWFPAVRAR